MTGEYVAAPRAQWSSDAQWESKMAPEHRERELRQWRKAVARTLDRVE